MKGLFPSLCALGLLLPVWGQVPTDDVGPGDFPALQLLPPGSIIKGISLPRYDNHRVSALITADEMEVRTRSRIRLALIHASLYAEDGETTTVSSKEALYDFRTREIQSPTATEVRHPRFTAQGTGVQFNTSTGVGLLKGPVHTTLTAEALSQNKEEHSKE